jgi:hypothetical protein
MFMPRHISPALPDVLLRPVVAEIVDAYLGEVGDDMGIVSDGLVGECREGGRESNGASGDVLSHGVGDGRSAAIYGGLSYTGRAHEWVGSECRCGVVDGW